MTTKKNPTLKEFIAMCQELHDYTVIEVGEDWPESEEKYEYKQGNVVKDLFTEEEKNRKVGSVDGIMMMKQFYGMNKMIYHIDFVEEETK